MLWKDLTKVPIRSRKTKNLIEKQHIPHRSGRTASSHKLWTVELIQRLRCENSTLQDTGAMVRAIASGVNLVLKLGKCFINSVVGNRSSPRENKFFLCRVSTLSSAYSSITRLEMMSGRPLSLVRMRYRVKQPGRHETEPKRLSKALDKLCEM